MVKLAKLGETEEDIRKKAESIDYLFLNTLDMPISDEILKFFDIVKENNFECRLMSDSNTFFIDSFLNKKNIRSCFSQIHTNYANFEDGVLKVTNYVVYS